MSRTGNSVAAFETHGEDLLHYLQRRVGDDAADLLGDVMVVVWKRADEAPADDVDCRRWLFGIARMTVLGHRRDVQRQLRLSARVKTALLPPPTPDHDEALDVRRAIAALPEDQAELVRLVHWEGLSLADAAQVMGLNASTARGRYQKAREELARVLTVASEPG